MTLEIKVLNKNRHEIVDYYDGIAYRFPPNEPVKIPQDAANHIFGVVFTEEAGNFDVFRETIYLHLQRRWGWNNFDPMKMEAARKTFDNIILSPVIMQLVEKELVEVSLSEPREEKPKFGRPPGRPKKESETEEEVA